MREFILSYEFEEGCWMISIMAESTEDAAQRVHAIRRSVALVDQSASFAAESESRHGRQRLGALD